MEEQIAKVGWWCSQGASHAHPDGIPAHHPLLPGISLPPSLEEETGGGGVAEIWEEGRNPGVPEGSGGWKGWG